ncbi:thrombospondin type 3 repeat-containing protein, partial [Akkermansiaceae bacterium]|nr:thrombospondin type 3 repeat-containing protein [Akkermansiaceae bacterium]
QEPDVHPPIPNKWWVENRVDPSWSDSPMQDKDGDGFFNGEEWKAKTNPSDPKSHGELISKLEVVSVSSDVWLLDFSGVIGEGTQFKFKFKPAGGAVQENRIPASQQLTPGEFFYPQEPGMRRFKLLKVEEKEVTGRFGPVQRKFATVEDQRPNKKGTTYVLPYQLARGEETTKHTYYDHTVTFRLNATGEASNSFEVEENGTFAIPQGSSDKSYKLLGVALKPGATEPESVSVEYGPAGAKKTITIPLN